MRFAYKVRGKPNAGAVSKNVISNLNKISIRRRTSKLDQHTSRGYFSGRVESPDLSHSNTNRQIGPAGSTGSRVTKFRRYDIACVTMNTTANNTWQWYRNVVMSWLEDPGVEEHQGLNISSLMMDEAFVVAEADRNVAVYSVSDDCFRCPFELQKTLTADFETWWVVDTARRSTWRVYTDTSDKYISLRNTTNLICQLRPNLGEFGVYSLNITGDGCDVQTSRDPVDIYMREL
ncbi:unnamed protein product [Leptosia nina]|uniref:Uncharacterized protein n=1 Tax=Leptosia nina TaxID=320188 RepID=A0AAV1JTX7_9NEOP